MNERLDLPAIATRAIRVVLLITSLVLAAGAAEAANGYCRDLPYAGQIPHQFGECRVWDGSPSQAVIAYDEGWGDNPEGDMASRLADTKVAIEDTMRFFRDLVTLPSPVLIYLTDRAYPERFEIPANYFAFNLRNQDELGGPCWVGVNPIGFEMEHDPYKQVMAHEIGHCMIDEYVGSISAKRDKPRDELWYEGIAEYLSNQIYLTTDNEDQYASAFLSDLGVFQDDYINNCFFQYYGNQRGGTRAVLDLAKKFGDHENLDDFIPVLDGISDIEELWHGFGRALADQAIADSASTGTDGVLPTEPPQYFALETIAVTPDVGEQTLVTPLGDSPSFTVYVQEISLAEEGRYRFQPPETDVGEIRASLERQGSWSALADEVTIDTCEGAEDLRILLSLTTASEANPRPTLAYSGEPNEECCVDTGRRDPCLVGGWELDASRLDRFVAGQMSRLRRPGDADAPERDVTMRGWIREDGTGRMLSKMHLVVEMPRRGGSSMSLATDSQSDVDSTWSTRDGSLYLCREDGRHEVTQTTDFASHNRESGESTEGQHIVEYVDGELVDVDGHVTMRPANDADAEQRAKVRADEAEMNRLLHEEGVPGMAGMPTPSLPDPWSENGPVAYTCSGDTLVLSVTPEMAVGEGSNRFTLPPMSFTFRRFGGVEPARLGGLSGGGG